MSHGFGHAPGHFLCWTKELQKKSNTWNCVVSDTHQSPTSDTWRMQKFWALQSCGLGTCRALRFVQYYNIVLWESNMASSRTTMDNPYFFSRYSWNIRYHQLLMVAAAHSNLRLCLGTAAGRACPGYSTWRKSQPCHCPTAQMHVPPCKREDFETEKLRNVRILFLWWFWWRFWIHVGSPHIFVNT